MLFSTTEHYYPPPPNCFTALSCSERWAKVSGSRGKANKALRLKESMSKVTCSPCPVVEQQGLYDEKQEYMSLWGWRCDIRACLMSQRKGWINVMFAHEQPLHRFAPPCGASHSRMDTYHITSHTKMWKSIKKLMSWEMTERERDKHSPPFLFPLWNAAFPVCCLVCIEDELGTSLAHTELSHLPQTLVRLFFLKQLLL